MGFNCTAVLLLRFCSLDQNVAVSYPYHSEGEGRQDLLLKGNQLFILHISTTAHQLLIKINIAATVVAVTSVSLRHHSQQQWHTTCCFCFFPSSSSARSFIFQVALQDWQRACVAFRTCAWYFLFTAASVRLSVFTIKALYIVYESAPSWVECLPCLSNEATSIFNRARGDLCKRVQDSSLSLCKS